ncbi:MAG: hypothetical protein KIT24_07865 [Phycisphaeraceae bacterium]|nr:hypothetical protein [Phycisphaeraceae bacterium]
MRQTMRLVAAAGIAAIASHASADAIVTFGFTDLAGFYDHGTGIFTAADAANTSGDVTRADPHSSAFYDVGFSGMGMAAVTFAVDVVPISATLASGTGTFSIVDNNGDTITGDITGTWIAGALGVFFNGDLLNVVFTDISGDGTFDGPAGGSFGTDLPGAAPYIGAIVQLFIPPGGNFFSSSFDVESVQVLGEIIPTPATAALLGLAGLGMTRRRRA